MDEDERQFIERHGLNMPLHNFMEFLSEHLNASPQVMGTSESATRGQPATVDVHLASGHSWELTVAYKEQWR